MAESNLHKLSARGQSVWIDSLSRHMLDSGELARLMTEDAVVGETTNPTIFQKAISAGADYDAQLRELLADETDAKEIFLHLSARDVERALDLFAPVHEQNPQDGFVSWEVDPTLAYDREGTFDEAMRLFAWIPKPNLYVKIPATKPGLGAIEDCVAHGKNINVTLIFSLQRYREVVEAYLRGLERGARLRCGHEQRVLEVDRRLERADRLRVRRVEHVERLAAEGAPEHLGGEARAPHPEQHDRVEPLVGDGVRERGELLDPLAHAARLVEPAEPFRLAGAGPDRGVALPDPVDELGAIHGRVRRQRADRASTAPPRGAPRTSRRTSARPRARASR